MHKVRGSYTSWTCRRSENIRSSSGGAQEKGKWRSNPDATQYVTKKSCISESPTPPHPTPPHPKANVPFCSFLKNLTRFWTKLYGAEWVGCSLQGVLAQAKNGDKLFWEEKFHAANEKTQACTEGAFFPFKFGGGERFVFNFLWFPMCSHHVPFEFAIGSHQVLNIFPNMFSIAPRFYPICFGKCCSPFTYIGGPKGRNSILQNITFYYGEPPLFQFCWVMGQINWLVARKKKLNLGGTSSN